MYPSLHQLALRVGYSERLEYGPGDRVYAQLHPCTVLYHEHRPARRLLGPVRLARLRQWLVVPVGLKELRWQENTLECHPSAAGLSPALWGIPHSTTPTSHHPSLSPSPPRPYPHSTP